MPFQTTVRSCHVDHKVNTVQKALEWYLEAKLRELLVDCAPYSIDREPEKAVKAFLKEFVVERDG